MPHFSFDNNRRARRTPPQLRPANAAIKLNNSTGLWRVIGYLALLHCVLLFTSVNRFKPEETHAGAGLLKTLFVLKSSIMTTQQLMYTLKKNFLPL